MNDQELHEWIDAVSQELDKREAKAPPLYWRDDDDGEYCRECFGKLFPTDDWGDGWGGGAYNSEQDCCVHCETCGKLLSYVLTDYGAEEELNHFEDNEWDWDAPDDCYHIARMLGCWVGWGAWDLESLPDRERVVKALQNGKNAPAFDSVGA